MAEAPVTKCMPEAGVYCQPLAKRVLGPINLLMMGGFGFVQRMVQVSETELKREFLGLAYRTPGRLGDPGLMLNFCPFCGVEIRREILDTQETSTGKN